MNDWGTADGGVGGDSRAAESRRPSGVGQANEQCPKSCDGNCEHRADFCIKRAAKRAAEGSISLPPFAIIQ